jgi:hypothetical protein
LPRPTVSDSAFFQALKKKISPYTLAGFDLTIHSSSLLSGRRRRYQYIDHAARVFSNLFSESPSLRRVS